MKNKIVKITKVTASVMCTALLFACNNASTTETNSSSAQASQVKVDAMTSKEVRSLISSKVTYSADDTYSGWKNANPTYIQFNGTSAELDEGAAVLFTNNTLTIKAGGVYVISGKLADGQIVVDAEDKSTVRIILNGAEISSSSTSAIYVKKAGKVMISLEKGTKNIISDASKYVVDDSSDDAPNAAIFSKSDLTINGTGSLVVNGNYNNGITSKDELRVTGGNIEITAADDGLMGRDLVAVKDGDITIKANGDGIKSSNDKDTSKGNIALEGGTFKITAAKDGIQAIQSLWIADGSYTITSGGGSPETISTNDEKMGGKGAAASTATTAEQTESTKGLKAAADLAVGGGTFKINSADDAVHSNANVTLAGGDFTIASGDDGVHSDLSLIANGGNIKVTKSYEGIEGQVIAIADGKIHVTASDDGVNVGGGNDGSGMDMQGESSNDKNLLQITGGYVYVNSAGDGLDSNGNISMTGGTVVVDGPTQTMNGSLDYGGSFNMSGGFLVAAGSSSMVQAASDSSKQNSILMTFPETQAAGTVVHVEDSKGNTVATVAPEKAFQSIFIGSAELKKDSTYTLYTGGTATGTNTDGLYKDASYKGGTKVVEFKISEAVTWLDESGVTTAKTSGPGGGGGGQRPEGGGRGGMFSGLDEKTKAQAEAIMQQEREGTITREEAQQKLKDLGVEFPAMKGMSQGAQ